MKKKRKGLPWIWFLAAYFLPAIGVGSVIPRNLFLLLYVVGVLILYVIVLEWLIKKGWIDPGGWYPPIGPCP